MYIHISFSLSLSRSLSLFLSFIVFFSLGDPWMVYFCHRPRERGHAAWNRAHASFGDQRVPGISIYCIHTYIYSAHARVDPVPGLYVMYFFMHK